MSGDQMGQDPLSGLDPDEIADVHTRLANTPDETRIAKRRVILMLLVFVLAFVPCALGTLWVASKFVYTPLCGETASATAVGVDIDLPLGAISASPEDPTTCLYSDGSERVMKDVISPGAVIALDFATAAVVAVLPFVVTYAVVRAVDRRR